MAFGDENIAGEGVQVDSAKDFAQSEPTKEQSELRRWKQEIERARKYSADWHKRVDQIYKRYRAESTAAKRKSPSDRKYNVLWSLVQTMQPNIFSDVPRAYVERRYKDRTTVGVAATQVLERLLNYGCDNDQTFEVLDEVVLDYLLAGRGTPWVRYAPQFELRDGDKQIRIDVGGMREDNGKEPPADADVKEDDKGKFFFEPYKYEALSYEECVVDHIPCVDFLHGPAAKWQHVPWVAKRVYMTRDELVARFGEKIGKDVSLKYANRAGEPDREQKSDDTVQLFRTAEVWEVWHRQKKEILWICLDYDKGFLDRKDDILKLPGFYPVPRPLFDTMTPNTLMPVPMFIIYQDIANELDELTFRISLLTEAMRVVGVYDAQMGDVVKRLTRETRENDLIPVENYAAFADAGGLKEAIQFLPIENIIVVIEKLHARREMLVHELYEITGISDIIRGDTDSRETASAQKIKGAYASKRLRRHQRRIARMAREVLEIKTEIICKHYDDHTILKISDAEELLTNDQGHYDPELFNEALALIRNTPMRHFLVKVDNTVMAQDEIADDKEQRMEFLQTVSAAIQQAMPVVQQAPPLGRVLKELVMFGVRAFPVARSVEAGLDRALEDLVNNIPPPEQEQQAQQGLSPEELQLENRKIDIQEQQLGIDRQRMMSEDAKRHDDTALKREEMAQFERLKVMELQIRSAGEAAKVAATREQTEKTHETSMADAQLRAVDQDHQHQVDHAELQQAAQESQRDHAVDVAQQRIDATHENRAQAVDLAKTHLEFADRGEQRDHEHSLADSKAEADVAKEKAKPKPKPKGA